jgi:hypothetical protein
VLADIAFTIIEIVLEPFGELIWEIGASLLATPFSLAEAPDPETEREAARYQEIPPEPPSALLSGTYLDVG